MDMSDVKVGDTVFIVEQKRRFSEQKPGFTATITKVGRKYAEAESNHGYKATWKFDRSSGCSSHTDCNARANGYGFDVYHNEAERVKFVEMWEAKDALLRRLDHGYAVEIRRLPHEAIMQITAILNQHKTDD
jgi:hypothetical protein